MADGLQPDDPIVQLQEVRKARANGHTGTATNWYSRCIAGRDGRTLSNLANTTLGLREDPAFKSLFSYDGMLDAALLTQQTPPRPNRED
jgi:hypothetical protein